MKNKEFIKDKISDKERKFIYDDILDVEESLMQFGVFYNNFINKDCRPVKQNCHMDSYMTLVDFEKLIIWFNKKEFNNDLLKFVIKYWKTNYNSQPPARMTAFFLESQLNEKI